MRPGMRSAMPQPVATCPSRPLAPREARTAQPNNNRGPALGDDGAERPRPLSSRPANRLQRPVAGRVTIAIVQILEVVDIDKGHHQTPVRPARPVDLLGK